MSERLGKPTTIQKKNQTAEGIDLRTRTNNSCKVAVHTIRAQFMAKGITKTDFKEIHRTNRGTGHMINRKRTQMPNTVIIRIIKQISIEGTKTTNNIKIMTSTKTNANKTK